ncbi:MAG: nucleotidyltransferase domain-containing protein, partial [Candidatus Nanohalobium sp.]
MTESKHREAFRDFAERAEEELGGSLEKLVLYGSVARGEEDDESDVDVLVVVE